MTDELHLRTLYADDHSQKAEDHPAEIIPEAEALVCTEHPDEGSVAGLGYAGGGFGRYRRCRVCQRVFQKTAIRDGNQS